ncbi:tetratricopeptide repeat protein [bacterium]|nr:tetratricopeptide repeat protein [bacterium]
MKKLNIIMLSSLLIFSCGNSPEKLLERGDKQIINSEIENAILSYQKIIDKFPDDSLAQTAQYNIAWIELDNKNDYSEGFELLNEIADKYPETEIGKSASEDIQKFPRWLMSKSSELRSDTTVNKAINTIDYLISEFNNNPIIPEALYLKGNIYLNDKKDFYRAINTYQKIVHKYKGSSFEPLSQFMIGYIYANIQTDIPKAKVAYQTFLQNYPEHELAPSVQFELEYLGKQINNIDELTSRNK